MRHVVTKFIYGKKEIATWIKRATQQSEICVAFA